MFAEAEELTVGTWTQDDVIVVVPQGTLAVDTANQLRLHLTKAATEHPRGLVVVLASLDVRSPALLTFFATMRTQLWEWPGVPVVVASATEDVAKRLRRWVPVRDSVPAAVAAVGEPPPRLVDRVLLPNEPASADIARRFARDSCEVWERPHLADDAALLLGELVANTVTHTRFPARVRVELRRGLLSVACYDDDPRRPPQHPPATGGLADVARTARAWGCLPTIDGGKVVWATLRVV
jgi:anti-anti-sigma regulatory factor